MTAYGRLTITDEIKNYIEEYWGPVEDLGDDDAQEIMQERITDNVISAYFEDDETIRYKYEVDEEDYENEPYPAFTPEYLRHIGMSMSDFI